jgi:hypothetical protein
MSALQPISDSGMSGRAGGILTAVTDAFGDWIDIDTALRHLGVALGLVSDDPKDHLKVRGILETNNLTSRGLVSALLDLVSSGLLEANFTVEDGVWHQSDETLDYAFRRSRALPG